MSSTWDLEGSGGEVAEQHESEEDADGRSNMNPFAAFEYDGATTAAVPASSSAPRASTGYKRKIETARAAVDTASTATRPPAGDNPKKKRGCKAERIGIGELSTEELRELRSRWRGVADRDAPVEDQRFQVLAGAILSSRAQATVVDEGMSRLRAGEGGLTAAAMSNMDQDDLAGILRHVHWNKAKAKHIRESASIIVRRHRGFVPRRRGDLLALPGVGPALVEILLNVFDCWQADDAAAVDAAAAGRSVVGGGGRSGEERRADTGSPVGGGGGAAAAGAAVGGDVDGTGSCGKDTESERRKNSDGDRSVDVDGVGVSSGGCGDTA